MISSNQASHAYLLNLHTGINLIFPFLPYMIHDFFPELDRTQIGKSIYMQAGTLSLDCKCHDRTKGWLPWLCLLWW